MATPIASTASICPRITHRGVTRRGAGAAGPNKATARRATVVTRAGATYDSVFNSDSGQMDQVLSQAVENVSTPGLEWSYRAGVPEDGVDVKPNKVLFVHGAGLVAFTYSKLMVGLALW
jgi:hypothetical protein